MHSLMEEWFSGNRRPGYYGTLTYALGVRNLLRIAPYANLATIDINRATKSPEASWWQKTFTWLTLIFLVWPLRLFFETGLIIAHSLAYVEAAVSDSAGFLLTILTLGLTLAYDQRWCYEVFMRRLEDIGGGLWQNSRIRISSPRRPCFCSNGHPNCIQGDCFTREFNTMSTRIKMLCKCYANYIHRNVDLKSEHPARGCFYLAPDEYIERVYPGQGRLVTREETKQCWKHKVHLHRRMYDTARLMWIETIYETTDDVALGEVTLYRSRAALDEELIVETTLERDEEESLKDWGSRIFSRQYQAGEGKKLVYESLVQSKVLAITATVVVAVTAVAAESEAGPIAAAVILLIFITQVVMSISTERNFESIFSNPKHSERIMDIDSISSARFTKKYNGVNACWTPHTLTGTEELGMLTWLENLVGNRTVICGDKALSLSRKGTVLLEAKVVVDGTAHCQDWSSVTLKKSEFSARRRVGELSKLDVGTCTPGEGSISSTSEIAADEKGCQDEEDAES
eukprot:GFKZ01012254.1.p1 GENE.GFKZ01012254.1~~GFKZ01012254.1.p1  ORF type:complete len:514 (-),score=41.80 GFKZ01012254.1:737-2278(-)